MKIGPYSIPDCAFGKQGEEKSPHEPGQKNYFELTELVFCNFVSDHDSLSLQSTGQSLKICLTLFLCTERTGQDNPVLFVIPSSTFVERKMKTLSSHKKSHHANDRTQAEQLGSFRVACPCTKIISFCCWKFGQTPHLSVNIEPKPFHILVARTHNEAFCGYFFTSFQDPVGEIARFPNN